MGSAAATSPAPEPTLEQYRMAYRQISRPGWPSFDACMQDHVRRTCLAGIARNLGRARWTPAAVAPSLPQGLPVPPTPDAPPQRRQQPSPITSQWSKARGVDMKRRAANDWE